MKKRLDRSIDWLLAARPLIVTAILGTGILVLRGEFTVSLLPFYILIAASYALSLIYWICFRVGLSATLILYIQIVGDILLVTSITVITGGIYSQFSVLYFLPIVYSSIFLVIKGAFTSASLSSIFYTLLLVGLYKGYLKEIFPLETDVTGSYVFFRSYLHTLLFFLVASMSGFLAERLRKRIHELAEIRLTTDDILLNIGNGLFTVDSEEKIVFFNKTAENILQLKTEDVKGHRFEDIFPKRLSNLKNNIVTAVKEKNSSYTEIEIGKKEGEKIPLGLNITSLLTPDGRERGVLFLFEDLTLKKRIARMAALGELSSGLAHEIRNPLASIRGATEVLSSSIKVEDANKKLFELILRETDRVNRSIREFLSFSRILPLHFAKLELGKIIGEVITLVKNNPSYKKGITIKNNIKEKIYLKGDREQLKQVFSNILLNGINSIDKKGTLKISGDHNGGNVSITIEDNGAGIGKKDLEKIWIPFYTKGKGFGLGLPIAKRIVQQHKGKIYVRSRPNYGSKFTIVLPKG